MTKVALRPNGYVGPRFSNLLENIFENEFPAIFNNEWKTSVPSVNIRDTKDAYVVDVIAPGFVKENFNVKVEENTLTISADVQENKQENEGEKYTRKEYAHSSFTRSFTLPKTVMVDKIAANYENGILKITLPKIEEAKAKGPVEVKIS